LQTQDEEERGTVMSPSCGIVTLNGFCSPRNERTSNDWRSSDKV